MENNKGMIGGKIRTFRMLRGFSQEHMAAKLGIDQTKYSRIESSKQKPAEDLLKNIADLLGVSVADINSNEPVIINNNASNKGTQIGHNENFYADQKELYEKLINTQKAENERLAKQNETLSKQIEQLMKMLEKKK